MNREEFELFKGNLPTSPDIIGREKYFNSAVLAPLVLIEDEFHLLFQRRAKSITQGDEICFPGGKYEPEIDSNFQDTALRETSEELGIDREQVSIIGELGKIVAPMGAAIDVFIGTIKASTLKTIHIDENEVAEIFTIPISFFKKRRADRYDVRVEMLPSYIDENQEEQILLPSKELRLPERYHQPWGANKHRILVYKTQHGPLWGLTAEIVHELVEKFVE